MTDLEYLTDTLDSLGFYYTIKNPPQPIPTMYIITFMQDFPIKMNSSGSMMKIKKK